MPYEIGATVALRDFQEDGRIRAVECGRVVADDEQGTAVWVGRGSAVIRRATLTGAPTRHLPVETKLRTPTLPTVGTWQGFGVLILTPPDAGHCLWWLFAEQGVFDGWYVNLQSPARRWWGGIDQESDLRAEAHRVIALAEARAAPFDGRWCDFRPDPSWRPTDLPWWWDLPRADPTTGSSGLLNSHHAPGALGQGPGRL